MRATNLHSLLSDLPHGPGETVIACDELRISRQELEERVGELAAALRDAGIRPGQPVGNLTGSAPAAVIAMFAVWAVGAVYVPMNQRSTAPEIQAFVADTPMAIVIGHARDLAMHTLPSGVLEHDLDARTSRVRAPADPEVQAYGADVALVLRTSGTTGRPKAVLLRHSGTIEGFDASLRTLRRKSGKPRDDTSRPPRMNLIPVSLALWAGIWNTLFSLRAGFGVVLVDRFEPREFARLVREYRVPSTILPPAMITMLVDAEEIQDLAPLRMVRSITAPLSPARAREFHRRFGAFVLNCYGQTELGGEVVGWNAADVREFGETKLGAAGRPYADVDLRILRADGSDADTDEQGEILVRSPFMMEGYAGDGGDPDRIVEGYLRTGDMGTLDADGFLWVEGRVSDMINRGGLKVFPDEVEEVLRRHPSVRDAAVAGVPDRRLGEVPHAWVVLADGHGIEILEALEAWCRESLVAYKIPAAFSVIDELPRSEIGKLLRRELTAAKNTASA